MQQSGHEIYFERRRYGRTTFTWIYVLISDKWQSTGDPLSKIMPSRSDIEEAIKRAHRHFLAECKLKAHSLS